MKKIRDNLATIVCGLAIVVAFVASLVAFAPRRSAGATVVVHDGDGVEHRFALAEDGSHAIRTSLGSNTIVIQNGEVRMEEADCPNGDCLRQRSVARPGEQIVCLPHRLWVEVVDEDGSGMDGLDAHAVVWEDATEDGSGSAVDLVAR